MALCSRSNVSRSLVYFLQSRTVRERKLKARSENWSRKTDKVAKVVITFVALASVFQIPCFGTYVPTRYACQHRTSTRQNQRASPFLRLPAELRKTIYGYALGGYRIGSDWFMTAGFDYPHANLGLHETCRQVYTETELLSSASTSSTPASTYTVHFVS
jgi:hypothetical protein